MGKDDGKWKVYSALVLLLFFVGVYSTARYYGDQKYELLENQGSDTVGVLYETAGEYFKYKYRVNGKLFIKGRREPYCCLQDTEEYKVKYLKEDPDKNFIDFTKPVLSTRYEYNEVECMSMEKTLSTVRFKYIVNDKIYTRKKFYESTEPLDASRFVVRYRVKNPKIGYLIIRN